MNSKNIDSLSWTYAGFFLLDDNLQSFRMNTSIVPGVISCFQSISYSNFVKTLSCLLIVSLESTEAAANDRGVEMIIHRKTKLISLKIKVAEITKDHNRVVIINERSKFLIDGWKIWYSTRMNSAKRTNIRIVNATIEYFPFENEQTNT